MAIVLYWTKNKTPSFKFEVWFPSNGFVTHVKRTDVVKTFNATRKSKEPFHAQNFKFCIVFVVNTHNNHLPTKTMDRFQLEFLYLPEKKKKKNCYSSNTRNIMD